VDGPAHRSAYISPLSTRGQGGHKPTQRICFGERVTNTAALRRLRSPCAKDSLRNDDSNTKRSEQNRTQAGRGSRIRAYRKNLRGSQPEDEEDPPRERTQIQGLWCPCPLPLPHSPPVSPPLTLPTPNTKYPPPSLPPPLPTLHYPPFSFPPPPPHSLSTSHTRHPLPPPSPHPSPPPNPPLFS